MPDLTRRARWLGLALLVIVTAVGALQFARGDADEALGFWRAQVPLLPWVLALAALDVALEALAALWIYSAFGVSAFDRLGITASLALRAGLLMPAQLGRLIRPDALARAGRGELPTCFKAEAATLTLDAISVVALVAGLAAGTLHPAMGVAAALAVATAAIAAGDRVTALLARDRLQLPRHFWWQPRTAGVLLLQAAGWTAHGAAFWILVRHLPGNVDLADSIFSASISAVLGGSSGVPGGIGVTEGLLGVSLGLMSVPSEHLALAVGGFRIATFWLWIPVGWAALWAVGRTPGKLGH